VHAQYFGIKDNLRWSLDKDLSNGGSFQELESDEKIHLNKKKVI
jgi:hypothetical protein